jgi:hypothetical protein
MNLKSKNLLIYDTGVVIFKRTKSYIETCLDPSFKFSEWQEDNLDMWLSIID